MNNKEISEKEKTKLIKQVCNSYRNVPTDNEQTFLSVIDRQYDENIISRIVAYILRNNNELCFNLVKKYREEYNKISEFDISKIDEIQVDCEVVMGKGRADIFVVLNEGKNIRATITIENKIRSWEHTTGNCISQTEEYAKYVKSTFSDSLNTFYYLKPSFNESKSKSEDFIDITYKEFQTIIGDSKDEIVNDFISHITKFLGEREFMSFNEWQLVTANNYKILKDIIKEYDNKLSTIKSDCCDRILENICSSNSIDIHCDWSKENEHCKDDDLFVERATSGMNNGIGSLRIYRKKWFKAEHYYFYIEIFFEYGDINKIYYQETLRNEKNVEYVNQYVDNVKRVTRDGKYIVLKRQKYPCKNFEGDDWATEFINTSASTLRGYISEMDDIFKQFEEKYIS